MIFNYQKICQSILKALPGRQKEVISRRFGLESGNRETLEAIGKSFAVTRERVRQIEEDAISKLKPKTKDHQKVFQYFTDHLKTFGELKKEDILLSQLAGQKSAPQVYFLLTLGDPFERFSETEKLHSLWTINQKSVDLAQKVIDSFYNKLKEAGKPLTLNEHKHFAKNSLAPKALESYLEVSKVIQKNQEGLFGLRDWPEINPRGIKDKAYLVFKKKNNPLHFREVAEFIGPKALSQTVHNELIRDPRFVLVGRGTYALRDWGYEQGVVKDVIKNILKEAKNPLTKEEVLEKVLQQRMVKENTILLNLQNKRYFKKNSEGKYHLS